MSVRPSLDELVVQLQRARFALAGVRRRLDATGPCPADGSAQDKTKWMAELLSVVEQANTIIERLMEGDPAPHLRAVNPPDG